MTSITARTDNEQARSRHETRSDNFWSQTVEENNQRLNNKNIPADALEEIKFIESVILTFLKDDRTEVGVKGLATASPSQAKGG